MAGDAVHGNIKDHMLVYVWEHRAAAALRAKARDGYARALGGDGGDGDVGGCGDDGRGHNVNQTFRSPQAFW